MTSGTYAVVLGAANGPDGRPSAALLRRTYAAARLHARGDVRRVILTGGATAGRWTEAAVMADELRRAGLPADCLHLEEAARTTRQNALYSLRLLAALAGPEPRIIVVTDAWHLPRALMLFAIIGWRQGLRPRLSGHAVRPADPSWRWHLGWPREAVACLADAVRVWWM